MKSLESIEGKILDVLYNRFMSNPGSPEMTFTELSQGIGFLLDNKSKGDFFSCLYSLKGKQWAIYQSIEDLGGLVYITDKGMRVAEDRRRRFHDMKSPVQIQLSSDSANYLTNIDRYSHLLSQRNELSLEIKRHISSKMYNFTILCGQPMVGKTRMLNYLSNNMLVDEYVPLVLTMQGLDSIGNIDAFTFDLSDQLTSKFNKWAESTAMGYRVDKPKQHDFSKNKGVSAFYEQWNNILQVSSKTPVIMLDEIERLLDFDDNVISRTLSFLYSFVLNNKSAYFIIVCSEDVLFPNEKYNKQFISLISKGEPVRIGYYDRQYVHSIISSTENFIIYEDEVVDRLMLLSDGHPRFLYVMLETIFSYIVEKKEKQNIEDNDTNIIIKKDDIDIIVNKIIEKIKFNLLMLLSRLSQEELFVLNIISRIILNIGIEQEYSLDGLKQVSNIQSSKFYTDLETGVYRLAQREWIEWNGNRSAFRFKLGILLFCIRYHYIDIAALIRRRR
jgi:hypothetical protein